MFDWRKRVEILRAQNALRDGRLDEAFAIASEKELRQWRACQVILEKLVDPLLDRAELHLGEGRLEEALADVERAQSAGGSRARVAEIRSKVCAGLEGRQKERTLKRDLVQSARRHLAQGSIDTGKALLAEVSGEDPEAASLTREARRREEKAREACARAELSLGEGALLEAARSAREAQAACPRLADLSGILLKLKAAGVASIETSLLDGSLAAAEELRKNLEAACGESLETRRSGEILQLCHEAAQKMDSGDYETAHSILARLRNLLPKAKWLEACEEAVLKVCAGLRDLCSGPLRGFATGKRGPAAAFASTIRGSPQGIGSGGNGQAALDRGFLLWVDGVGSYLVLRSDRVTMGRAGSSSRPDLALAADIAGIQAEILRVDDDYFVAAHGGVEVNGRRVDRKLLAGGDRIRLSPKCELVFRIPTALSTSAVLQLSGGQRIAGDVKEVILLDRCLLIGKEEGCHVRAGEAAGRIVLCEDDRGLTVRAEEGIVVGGKPQGKEATVPAETQIKVGEVTFVVTPLEGERS